MKTDAIQRDDELLDDLARCITDEDARTGNWLTKLAYALKATS